jgi:LPXTG-site transpeptidase (sortase) family protein
MLSGFRRAISKVGLRSSRNILAVLLVVFGLFSVNTPFIVEGRSWGFSDNKSNDISLEDLKSSLNNTNAELDLEEKVTQPIEIVDPSRLIIPSYNIDVALSPNGYNYNKGVWYELSKKDAHYFNESPLPNNIIGQTFIYGHNSNAVFGAIKNLKFDGSNVELYIYNQSGKYLKYILTSSRIATPNEVDILRDLDQKEAGIMLMTCNGWADTKRNLLFFSLAP